MQCKHAQPFDLISGFLPSHHLLLPHLSTSSVPLGRRFKVFFGGVEMGYILFVKSCWHWKCFALKCTFLWWIHIFQENVVAKAIQLKILVMKVPKPMESVNGNKMAFLYCCLCIDSQLDVAWCSGMGFL